MIGNILTWKQSNPGLTHPQQYRFGYDALDELTSASLQDTVTNDPLDEQVYRYDAAMNRISVQHGSGISTETVNSLNQVTGTSGGGLMRFAGTVSKPAQVSVGGNPATVRADNSYEGWAQVAGSGTTRVHVVATDGAGQAVDKYTDVAPGAVAAQTFGYDLNGNQTAAGPSGGQATYGWDAVNRLASITQGGSVTRFDYDGQGRRVREWLGGNVIKQWVWSGLSLAEERDASNNVTKRFFGQGEQIAGQSYYYTRDHLGTVRELVDGSQTVRARYSYDPYGVRSANLITSNPIEADFGFTGHYFHQLSGLHLAPFRAYSGNAGRWTSRDPIGEEGGLNQYGYVFNSPVNLLDPLGLDAILTLQGVYLGNAVNSSEFGGGRERGHMPSAYGPFQVNADNPEAALPFRLPPDQKQVDVYNPRNNNQTRCNVTDVGPWNTRDPYWNNGTRPMAESQYDNRTRAQNGQIPSNNAGIDLTPGAMNNLGFRGPENTRQGPVGWNFPNEPFSGYFPFYGQ